MDPVQQMGPNLEKKELRIMLFLPFIFYCKEFSYYILCIIYMSLYIEIEVYYAEVQCSIFCATNFIQST